MNRLFFGDTLEVLRNSIADESADLIYLDPPFNSNAYYNVIFGNSKTAGLPQAQITAFEDTWHWNSESSRALNELFDRCFSPIKARKRLRIAVSTDCATSATYSVSHISEVLRNPVS